MKSPYQASKLIKFPHPANIQFQPLHQAESTGKGEARLDRNRHRGRYCGSGVPDPYQNMLLCIDMPKLDTATIDVSRKFDAVALHDSNLLFLGAAQNIINISNQSGCLFYPLI